MRDVLVTAFSDGPHGHGQLLRLSGGHVVETHDHDRTFRGLCCADGKLFTIDYAGTLFRVDLFPLRVTPLLVVPFADDAHDLTLSDDGRIVTCSPQTLRVLMIDLASGRVETRQPLPDPGTRDPYHLNSALLHRDCCWLSVFTLIPDRHGRWRDTEIGDGRVLEVRNGNFVGGVSRLWRPHSLRWHRNELWYCESARNLVCNVSGKRLLFGGFTRGLSFIEATAAVGISGARDSTETARVVFFDPDSGAVGPRWNIAAAEIYDVLIL